MKHTSLITILILIICQSSSYTQGDYLKLGEDGHEIDLTAQYSNDVHGIGGIFGLSVKGIFDLSISYVFAEDNKILTIGSAAHCVKQEFIKIPLNLAFYFGMSMTSPSSTKSTTFGMATYSNIKVSDKTTLQPSFQIATINTSVYATYPYNDFNYNDNATGFGLSFFSEISANHIFKVDLIYARAGSGRYETTHSGEINFGFIFRISEEAKN
jgi:hypothetical protein